MKGLLIIASVAVLSGFGTVSFISRSIDHMIVEDWPSSPYVEQNGFMVWDGPAVAGLRVETSHKLQPYGDSAEDDDTAQNIVQPTHSPMVTRHYYFLQGSEPDLQGTSPVLQAKRTQSN